MNYYTIEMLKEIFKKENVNWPMEKVEHRATQYLRYQLETKQSTLL